MPYELQTDPILAGSLNLLSPGELGGETDAIAMHNWRVDQGGQLRSRLGMGAAVATALGAYVHSMARVEAAAPRRYFGADTNWFRGNVNISSGFDGNPFGMVSFQGKCWAMNRSKQLKDDGANTWAWTPTAPVAAPTATYAGAGGGLNGIYSYYVTGVTDAGEETNPSPALVTPALVNDVITVIHPAFADPQITHWNIYRQGGAFPTQRYLVNFDFPRSVGSPNYVDFGDHTVADQTDNGVANAGVILEVNHDPAPAAKFVAGPYLSRLYVFGTAAHPNRMFYTEPDQPAFFPGSGTNAGGNWSDVGELGEEFIGCAVFPQVLLIIKSKSVWRLIGDPTNGEMERLNIDVGGIGIKAWAVAGATIYFQSQEGISRTSVSSTGLISPDLTPIFKGDPVEAYGAIPAAPIDPSAAARGRAAMAFVNGRLYFSYASLGGTGFPDAMLVWNEKTQQWGTDSRRFNALFYEGQGGYLLGSIAGSVYPLEQGTDDNGTSFVPIYQTRFRNQGKPNVQKHYANLEIEHRLNGANVKVSVVFDGKGSTLTQVAIITSGADKLWSILPIPDFNSGNEPRSIAVRIELVDPGSSYIEILAMAVRWYPVPLDGLVFDSGNVKLAGGQTCLVKNIELDIENIGAGTVSYEWFSDLPGNAIVSHGATVLADIAGIGTFQITAPVKYARWARLIIRVSAGACRVFGARVQVRPVGVYLDGVSFDSQMFKLDNGQPCFIENLELDLECDGAGPVTCEWFSDLPGNAITSKGIINVPGVITGAGTYRVPLPVTEAAWARIIVRTEAGICRVFGARINVRPIGLYLAGTGDGYTTAELTVGSPRLKLLSAIRISAQADGNMPVHLQSDIPQVAGSTSLGEVGALSIPATTERQWVLAKLPSTTRAKLIRLVIDSTAVARIFQILIRVKALGESPSAWQWFEVPIPQTPDVWTKRELPVPRTPDEWQWADLPIK